MLNSDDEVFDESNCELFHLEDLSLETAQESSVNQDCSNQELPEIQTHAEPVSRPTCKWSHIDDFQPRNYTFDASNSGL